MRITRLELENITSLKNKHIINFDKINEDSDLFAITGPTGSGKSTILTAISMALYGEHPKGINAADMVSTGTGKGRITLQFKKRNDTYDINWTCQTLKKDGSPRKSPLTSRVISKNEAITEEDIQDIIGLTFSQFSKVAILNQGQFSEFLSSSFTQRKDLLEKLLEHHDLKTLAPYLKRKIKELNNDLDSLEQRGQSTLLLTEEDLEKVTDELKGHKTSIKDINSNLDYFSSASKIILEQYKLSKKWIEGSNNLAKENKEIEELVKEITANKKTLSIHKEKLEKIEKENKSQTPLIERAKVLLQKKENLKEQDTKIKSRIKELEEKRLKREEELNLHKKSLITLEKLIQETSQTKKTEYGTEKLENAVNIIEKVTLSLKQVLKNKEDLKYFEKEKLELEKRANEVKEQQRNTLNWFSKLVQNISPNKNNLSENIRELHKFVKDVHAQIEEKKERSKEIKQAIEYKEDHLKLENSKIQKNEEIILGLTKELTDTEKESHQLSLTLESETKSLQHLELLSLAFNHLKNGHHMDSSSPCPVCDNPLDKETLEIMDKTLTKENYQEKNQQIKTLAKKIEETKATIIKIVTQKQSLESDVINSKAEARKSKEDLNNLKRELTTLEDNKHNQGLLTQEVIDSANEKAIKQDSFEQSLNEYRESWTARKNKTEELNKSIETINREKETLLQKLKECLGEELFKKLDLTEPKIEQSVNFMRGEVTISKKIEESLHQLEKLNTSIRNGESGLVEVKTDIEKATQEQLEIEKESLAIKNEFDIKALPLKPLELEAQNYKKIEEQRITYEEQRKETQTKEMLFEKKNGQINILKEQITGTEDLLKRYDINLRECLEGQPDIKLVEESLRPTHTYLLKCKSFDFKNNEQVRALENFYEDELCKSVSILKEMQQDINRQIIVLETRIEENEKQKVKLQEIIKKKESLNKTLVQLEELGPYLLKDGFRDFALEVLEENLLSMANMEISSLAEGRYELVHGKAGKRSELLVRDLWQGNTLRKVSTLSGGETFLLSLGLALGLSEITRGQTEIETFFIDEGFGTLDGESISQVLSCLMQMQSRGKQIGIISHVKALTDQIPVRIDLEKNNFGESQIMIV